MKYKDWSNEWLALYVKPTTKIRTYKKYRQQIEQHILPSLGEFELHELTATVLQHYTVDLTKKELSANTVNGIISVLKSSLRRAVLFGVADKEFTDAIVRPKQREKQVDCLSKEEQRKIERYIIEKKKNNLFGVVLCLYTGLRIGELLALTWDDVDLEKGIITVSKSCHDSWQNGSYVKIIDTPKTDCSVRTIPVAKQLLVRLKGHKKSLNDNYVVAGRSVHGAQIRSYQKTFEILLKRLRVAHKGFHSLRHTFATRALECGMDIKTLSEILGHKNPTVTLNRYAHSLLEHKTEMMNRVGKLLF
ncbi:MAG: site-specific integrase [Clostridiales bacterium]|nr:site-specific integrase [Clostridiales bacterium]